MTVANNNLHFPDENPKTSPADGLATVSAGLTVAPSPWGIRPPGAGQQVISSVQHQVCPAPLRAAASDPSGLIIRTRTGAGQKTESQATQNRETDHDDRRQRDPAS